MNAENLHVGLTTLVLVSVFFVGIIAWFLRKDVARFETMLNRLEIARGEADIKVAKLEVKVENISGTVFNMRSQLVSRKMLRVWGDADGDGK